MIPNGLLITNKSIAIGLPATGPLILVTVFVVTGFGSRVGFCSGSVVGSSVGSSLMVISIVVFDGL